MLRRTSIAALLRAGLPYDTHGISSHADRVPRTPTRAPSPQCDAIAESSAIAARCRAWRIVTWRNGRNRPWKAQFAALRVTPAQRWPHRRRAAESGSCANGISARRRASSTTSSPCRPPRRARPGAAGASAVGDRAAVQELKDELGLDHFEGRSFVGWHRHVVLTAMAYSWLQDARRRAGARLPTLPVARAVITEILTAHFFVTRPLLGNHAETRGNQSANLTKYSTKRLYQNLNPFSASLRAVRCFVGNTAFKFLFSQARKSPAPSGLERCGSRDSA